MHPDLWPLVGRPYEFSHSPGVNPGSEAINCQLGVHLAYRQRFNITIPAGMWSAEIFQDESIIFQTVPILDYEGDIGIFGPVGQNDPRFFHLAYHLGNSEFFHANIIDRQASIWPLEKFLTAPRYAELKRVKRLMPDLWTTQILPVISC